MGRQLLRKPLTPGSPCCFLRVFFALLKLGLALKSKINIRITNIVLSRKSFFPPYCSPIEKPFVSERKGWNYGVLLKAKG